MQAQMAALLEYAKRRLGQLPREIPTLPHPSRRRRRPHGVVGYLPEGDWLVVTTSTKSSRGARRDLRLRQRCKFGGGARSHSQQNRGSKARARGEASECVLQRKQMETAKVPAAAAAAEREQKLLQEPEGYYADDEELFEIDLEVLSRIPPPSNQVFELDLRVFDRLPPAAKDCQQSALLANCILPVTYICNAVPIDAAAAAGGRAERKDADVWGDLTRMLAWRATSELIRAFPSARISGHPTSIRPLADICITKYRSQLGSSDLGICSSAQAGLSTSRPEHSHITFKYISIEHLGLSKLGLR
ncbi:hypothetical protein Taro_046050 [Colocasia esculenta]|uniref:Uncharacterized protein n=1 Tax=Colocasia esculenta TaxID=4460 RepID=A0A843WSS5_COLES|nr:hypothetical protein [Colocasia esculenta]